MNSIHFFFILQSLEHSEFMFRFNLKQGNYCDVTRYMHKLYLENKIMFMLAVYQARYYYTLLTWLWQEAAKKYYESIISTVLLSVQIGSL